MSFKVSARKTTTAIVFVLDVDDDHGAWHQQRPARQTGGSNGWFKSCLTGPTPGT